MSIPEPKFAVGECVMVRSADWPSYNTDNALVLHRDYVTTTNEISGEIKTGWYYVVDIPIRADYLCESALRKRPEPGQDWESLRDSLKLPQVETA